MSKKINTEITCPDCHEKVSFIFYRTIWGEIPENRDLVFSDSINCPVCPKCNFKEKLEIPFMYTNVEKNFAVWWEPIHDSNIDQDALEYKKIFGDGNFYQTAPRIKDWKEFKETILKFENGELKGQKAVFNEKNSNNIFHYLNKNTKNNYRQKIIIVTIFLIILAALYFL